MTQQTFSDAVLVYPLLNADVSSGAAISASKLQQNRYLTSDFGFNTDDTPTTTNKVIYVAQTAATLKTFAVMLTDTGTTTSIAFDILINGTSALTAAVTLTNASTDNVLYNGTLTTTALSAGDVVTIDMTVTTSTAAHGPLAIISIDDSYLN